MEIIKSSLLKNLLEQTFHCIRISVYCLQCIKNCLPICEHPICQQKCVQEINAKKAQIGESFQKSVQRGISDLRHFAGVEDLAESDGMIIFEKAWIRPVAITTEQNANAYYSIWCWNIEITVLTFKGMLKNRGEKLSVEMSK